MTDPVTATAAPYTADADDVHAARIWLGTLWGPMCDPGVFFTVPLISAIEKEHVTCPRCREAAYRSEPTSTAAHRWRFDGDDPYIVCACGEYRDALTGRVIKKGDGSHDDA